jgi:hypothetical protein
MKWKAATLRSGHPLLVVGQLENGDKSDKWWITRSLDTNGPVGKLWITVRLTDVSSGTSYWSEVGGGRRTGVVRMCVIWRPVVGETGSLCVSQFT